MIGAKDRKGSRHPLARTSYTRKSILALLEQNRGDADKAAAVTAAFGENLIDIHNGDHAETVQADIREKIVGRFLDSGNSMRSSAQSRGSSPRSRNASEVALAV